MGLTRIVPDVLLTADERSLLTCARRLGRGLDDSVPLLAIAEALGWPVKRAESAPPTALSHGGMTGVDVGLGDGDDLVFVDA